MKKQPLKYRMNVIGAALIIFLCVRTYMPMLGQTVGLIKNFTVWIIYFMVTLALSCLLPIAFMEKMCEFHPVLFGRKKFDLSSAAIVAHCMLLFIVMAVVTSLLLIPLEKAGIVFPVVTLSQTDNFFTLILYFIFTAAVPAIFEELMLRGLVLNLLLPYGRRFAVIASALIFTIMHTQIQSFPPVFVAGIVLACIYLYTDNIYLSMIMHFTNNAYSFIMMYVQQFVGGVSAAGFASFVISVIIVCGICGWFYLKKAGINIFTMLEKGKEKNASLSVMVKSPVMVLAVIMCMMSVFAQLYADLGL